MIRYWGGPCDGQQVQARDLWLTVPQPGGKPREARPSLPPFEDWVTGDLTYAPLGSYARYVCDDWCDCGACAPRFRFVGVVLGDVLGELAR